MRKKVCDRCDNEPVAIYKFVNTTGNLELNFGIPNTIYLCAKCLIRAITEGDDEP